jgi:hypothetical protein
LSLNLAKNQAEESLRNRTFGHKYIRKSLILKELMASLNIPSLEEPPPLAYKKLKAKVEVMESLQTWNRKIR